MVLESVEGAPQMYILVECPTCRTECLAHNNQEQIKVDRQPLVVNHLLEVLKQRNNKLDLQDLHNLDRHRVHRPQQHLLNQMWVQPASLPRT